MTQASITSGAADYEMIAKIRNHTVTFDEPTETGGGDKGPRPTEMLCAALASCTSITIKMYLNHKKWTTDGISVEVSHSTDAAGKNIFKRTVAVRGNFDADQKNRILAIANKCPVHKILEGSNTIETTLQ